MGSTLPRLLLSLACLLPSTVCADLPGSLLDEYDFSEQAQNAADAAWNAYAGARTKGETWRGGSGPLINLALSSANLICESWMISIRASMRDLTTHALGLASDDDQTQVFLAVQRLSELQAILERECTRMGFLGDPPPVDDGPPTEDGPGETPGDGPTGTGGGQVTPTPLPGETVADYNCRRRCQPQYDRWQREERRAADSEGTARQRRRVADSLEQSLNEGRQGLAAARAELSRLVSAPPPPMSGRVDPALERQWTRYHHRISSLRRNIEDYQADLQKLAPKVDQAKAHADSWDRHARDYRQRAERAKSEYEECMKKCLDFAVSIGDPTTIRLEQSVNRGGNNPFDPQRPIGVIGQVTGTPTQPAACTAPQPPTANQQLPCPAGQSGVIAQAQASSCLNGAWVRGPWQTTSNSCTAVTPPPPQGCTAPQPAGESQTLACPSGQTGSIVQTRAYSCQGTSWVASAWQTTSNTCTTPPPPPPPPPAVGCTTNFSGGTYSCSGSCGVGSAALGVVAGSGSMTATIGSNSGAAFSCAGATANSQSTNLIILGAPGHRCTLTGTSATAFGLRCQNETGGSCTSSCTR